MHDSSLSGYHIAQVNVHRQDVGWKIGNAEGH